MVIATYDEAESIQKTVAEVLSVPGVALVTIVDGESPNGTAADVLPARAADRYVEPIGLGKAVCGQAVRLGLWRSIAGNCSYVANMDADGPHFATDTPLLVNVVSGADLVIGPRCVKGASITGWSGFRRLMRHCWNAYASVLNNMAIPDMSTGFQCFNEKFAAFAPEIPIIGHGFAYHVAPTHRADKIRRQDFRSPHPVSSPPSRRIQAVVCHGGGSNSHRSQPRGGKPDTAGFVSCLLK